MGTLFVVSNFINVSASSILPNGIATARFNSEDPLQITFATANLMWTDQIQLLIRWVRKFIVFLKFSDGYWVYYDKELGLIRDNLALLSGGPWTRKTITLSLSFTRFGFQLKSDTKVKRRQFQPLWFISWLSPWFSPAFPSVEVWWNLVECWLRKAKWASWAWGHYFRYLVYIDPGIRYLVLTKLGTIVDIMIYNQF